MSNTQWMRFQEGFWYGANVYRRVGMPDSGPRLLSSEARQMLGR